MRPATLVPTRTLVLAEVVTVLLGVSVALVRIGMAAPAQMTVGIVGLPALLVLLAWITRDLDRYGKDDPAHRAAKLALGLFGLSLALLVLFTQAIGVPLPWEGRDG